MSGLRTGLMVLVLITVCAWQIAAWQGNQPVGNSSGPALGEWTFIGKDNQGIVWTGTLTLGKVDPERFSKTDKYHSVATIDAQSSKGGLGVEHPSTYDPATRTLSFGKEGKWGGSTYTAVLSADGKKLENGKWRRSERDFGAKEPVVVSTGDWTAELIQK